MMTIPVAHRVGLREGLEARKQGKPRKSPYADADGKPIKAFRVFHDAWLKGWDAGTYREVPA